MTTYTIQGFSRVLDYDTNTYSGFGTAQLRLVRPDGAGTLVHNYVDIDEENAHWPFLTAVLDFQAQSTTLSRPGAATHELQLGFTHIERFVYQLDWGVGKHTYMHVLFQPMTGEEYIFGMTGDALPAMTTLAQLNTLMKGAKHWVHDGPLESGQEIALSVFQKMTMTQNDKVTADGFNPLLWNAGLGNDTMMGGDMSDTLMGGAGNDRITTGGGGNVAMGGDGNDTITGSATASHDQLFGGAGNDVIVALCAQGANISTGSGDDKVTLGSGVENGGDWQGRGFVSAGSGNDTIAGALADDYLVGDAGNDSITGDGGRDVLRGGRGNDTLSGGDEADQLRGGSGTDRMAGGAGDDLLEGEAGADRLTGGTGVDLFAFRRVSDSTVTDSDAITDFVVGTDQIDLHNLDANAAVAGVQGFTWRVGAFTALGQLRIVASGGDTYITGNTTGTTAADFRIVIENETGLSQADFIL